jgi:hypothetical protein
MGVAANLAHAADHRSSRDDLSAEVVPAAMSRAVRRVGRGNPLHAVNEPFNIKAV